MNLAQQYIYIKQCSRFFLEFFEFFSHPNYGFEISANSQECENARFSKTIKKYRQSRITQMNLVQQYIYIKQCSRFFLEFLKFFSLPNYGFEISANSQECENARFSKAN